MSPSWHCIFRKARRHRGSVPHHTAVRHDDLVPTPPRTPGPARRRRHRAAAHGVGRLHRRRSGRAAGPVGSAALARGDRAGVARELRGRGRPRALADLVRLFLLGLEVDAAAARRALAPLPVADAVGRRPGRGPRRGPSGPGWTCAPTPRTAAVRRRRGGSCRTSAPTCAPGRWPPDHVLGIGAAALTLAQATPAAPGRPRPGRRHRVRGAGAAPGPARRRGHRDRHQPARAAAGRDDRRAQRAAVGPAARAPARAGGRRDLRPHRGEPAVRRLGRRPAATTTATAVWPGTR